MRTTVWLSLSTMYTKVEVYLRARLELHTTLSPVGSLCKSLIYGTQSLHKSFQHVMQKRCRRALGEPNISIMPLFSGTQVEPFRSSAKKLAHSSNTCELCISPYLIYRYFFILPSHLPPEDVVRSLSPSNLEGLEV